MKIAVEGCCHGALDAIYDTIGRLEKINDIKIDLLLICGDFQSVRNHSDLQAMAVPQKYQHLESFWKYYNGEKKAPILTIFIGGNHEASNYLQELTYGGWVAPNIYFLGKAGVVQVGGVRIGGVSGIYKGHDYCKGHFERPPYTDNSKRSVYHVRNLEVFRLKQVTRDLDIFMSHDWPQGIYHHGDTNSLIKKKPFFKKEIEDDSLGSRPLGELLVKLKPQYWFAAHLHVKFAAHVLHQTSGASKQTKFLALDKCLPRRQFLQVLDIPHKESEGLKLKLDPEWLTILRTTNHLLKLSQTNTYLPGPGGPDRYNFQVEEEEMKETVDIFGGDLTLPENFVQTCPPIVGTPKPRGSQFPLNVTVNPQTSLLCTMLELTDPMAKFLGKSSEDLLDESFATAEDNDSGPDVVDDDDDDDGHDEMPSFIDDSLLNSSQPSIVDVSKMMDLPQPSSQTAAHSSSSDRGVSLGQKSTSFGMSSLCLESTGNSLNMSLPAPSNKESNSTSDSLSFSLPPPSNKESNSSDSLSFSLPPPSNKVSNSTSDSLNMSLPAPSNKESSSTSDSLDMSLPPPSNKVSESHISLTDTSPVQGNPSAHASPSTPTQSKKRDSSDSFGADAITSTPIQQGSSSKKLKRRNASMYSEPV